MTSDSSLRRAVRGEVAASGKASKTPKQARLAKPAQRAKPAQIAKAGKADAGSPATYHHGDLREALLKSAEAILERDGIIGLTLRAAAREAGVSHAAPTHHFGDLTGLVSELAAVGFQRFSTALAEAAERETTPAARFDAMGSAYVAFALKSPGLFMLMFRSERLDMRRPALRDAVIAAGAALAGAIGRKRQENVAPGALSLAQAADMVRGWSMVHGFAVLLLDSRLAPILSRIDGGADAQQLLHAVMNFRPGPPPV